MARDTKKKEGGESARTGTTDPADRRLAEWIARQWRHDEQPTRIEAYRMSKVKRLWVRDGVSAYSRTFKTSEKMDIDIAAKLSNDIMGDCQAHCDAHPSKAPGPITYVICMSDPGRSGNARNEVVERPILLYPQRLVFQPTEASAARSGGGDDEDEDGDDGSANSALRKTLAVMSEREQWRVETENSVIGDYIQSIADERKEYRAERKELHEMNMSLARELLTHLRSTREFDIIDKDREPARIYEMAKATLVKEGVGALAEGVKVIKYLVMGAKSSDETKTIGPGPTRLQALVSEFLSDCEREKIDEVLFGKVEDGRIVEGGIFTQDQVRLLVQVSEKRRPDTDLEKLLPDSGDVLSVTTEQYLKAGPVLEKVGLADAIKIVFGFCIKARKARMEKETNAAAQ